MSQRLLVITGPTASGKTRRAVQCASAFGGEIISADSRQVFRGMDIGSGKDIEEYLNIPYHLIDIRPAGYQYNLYEFLSDYTAALGQIIAHGHLPILCGGTGMYIEAAIKGTVLPSVGRDDSLRQSLEEKSAAELARILATVNPARSENIDLCNPRRMIRAIELTLHSGKNNSSPLSLPEVDPVIVGVDIDRDARRSRITQRLVARLENGLIEEVEGLISQGVSTDALIAYGLEYKYVTLYLTGQLSRTEMQQLLEIAIHQFAKRQMTWFRGMERRGLHINWIPWDISETEFIESIDSLLQKDEQ